MVRAPVSTDRFREQLLGFLDRKDHWAWPFFSEGRASKEQFKLHFQQEYAVYVRDFPVLLARIHGHNHPAQVRSMLATNIYEEDTGGLSLGRSHPDLFLAMMDGLGFPAKDFERVRLLPASRAYRSWLDRVSRRRDWLVGAAALTVFVEGSVKDRQELLHPSEPKTPAEIEAHIARHPLVRHYGLSPDSMDLTRAHQMVEAGHRHDAYDMVLGFAVTAAQQQAVLACLKTTLALWLRYRDGIARACGLKKAGS
ncbi:MAG: iron-containing redox enzyme family protein [Nitrospirota bacterium]|nr:iron-containing redox enzyme family protein [Nitrospirota bacterium]